MSSSTKRNRISGGSCFRFQVLFNEETILSLLNLYIVSRTKHMTDFPNTIDNDILNIVLYPYNTFMTSADNQI